MSFFPGKDPAPGDERAADAIDLMIVPRSVDVGHFAVRRALPHVDRRMVGPFIFFDHFGPAEFRSGQGIDVRPHPHIGLATVTFLFDGEIMHRDSLGTNAAIRPGEVNWMSAGRGIVHSERTAPDRRRRRRADPWPAVLGGVAGGGRGKRSELFPSRQRIAAARERRRQDGAGHRRQRLWRALAGRRRSRRRCLPT